ncbi:MAG: alkaline phosphatase family protein [Thermodesulfobacteriota bacterium]|nr:alkaline phosphatase family protein [Thermodesulfobacteriota bacterium]
MRKISVFMFIDALGWEIIKDRDFLKDLLPHRYRVQMQFGYSSTAIPTILTGEKPTVHKHLSFYYYAPDKSPFKLFRMLLLPYMPGRIVDRWRVRHILSKLVAKLYGYTGYFELYAMPFDRIHYFDYIEKTDIFVPGGLAPVKNLADKLEDYGIPYHISNWRLTEDQNIEALMTEVQKGDISFAFLYTAAMDGLLHMVTKDGKEIDDKLQWYSDRIHRLVDEIKKSYDEYYFAVLSDHGMTTLAGVVDVKSQVERSGLEFGKDYVAVYDATMVRVWFMNEMAEAKIINILGRIPHSHILSEAEEKRYHIDFEDKMYGDKYLLMDPGWQIEPCDMGTKALPAMHGFAPEHEDSYATLLSCEPVDIPLLCVDDFHRLMVRKMME